MISFIKIINYLLTIVGIKPKELIGYIQNNHIVYSRDTDKYYNLSPIKPNQDVWYKTEQGFYEECKVLNILKDNKYYVQIDIYGTESLFVTHRDKLFPHKPETKVKGHIEDIYFIIHDEKKEKQPKESTNNTSKLDKIMLSMLF